MQIRTDLYTWSHGTQPKGNGQWAFQFYGANINGIYGDSMAFAPMNLSYADAKRWARNQGKTLGTKDIAVLP